MKHLLAPALLLLAGLSVHAQAVDDQAERARIQAERTAAEQRFAGEDKACRARFAVTGCVNKARRQLNAALADLRRQELVLNEAERKRQAAQRQQELDERAAPERQQEAAERRAKALQEQQARESRFNEKAARRAAEQQEHAAHPRPPKAPNGPPAPQGTPRGVRNLNTPQPDASQAARNRAKYEARLREAEEHRKAVQERAARRSKPPASALPAPP
jgi:hypothetical protein